MSTRSTSSATQRPHLGEKQKSSGWAWPRLVRAEPQKSPASTARVSVDTDPRIDVDPALSLAHTSLVEGIPSPTKIPQAAENLSAVSSPTRNEQSGTSNSTALTPQEDKSHPAETSKALNRFTDPSSSQETVVPEGPSTPSSPKIFQWDAAKKPQIHEPTTAYKSERTSVAEAARRLESLDQASHPTTGRSPGSDQGLHSALPGVPFTLAQVMASPRLEKNTHSFSPNASNEETHAPSSNQFEEAPHDKTHTSAPNAHSTHGNVDGPIPKACAFLHQHTSVSSEPGLPFSNLTRYDSNESAPKFLDTNASIDVAQHSNAGSSPNLASYEVNGSTPMLPDADIIEGTAHYPDSRPEPSRWLSHEESHNPVEQNPTSHLLHIGAQAAASEQTPVTESPEIHSLTAEKIICEPRDLESEYNPFEAAPDKAAAGQELPPAGKRDFFSIQVY